IDSVLPRRIPSVRRDALRTQRNWVEIRRDLHASSSSPFSGQLRLARMGSHLHVIHVEIHQMAPAIGNVASSGAASIHPAAIAERPVDLGVDATLPDSGICDAREIGLA